MEQKLLAELISAIQEDKQYDWLANNYYLLSKEELKDLALELIWALNQRLTNEELIDNLIDRLS